MAVNLSPIWGAGAQLFDNSGNVLSGGKIYTYAAGTTTPATTYTSSSGITANSNPIILNSAGRVPYEIWLTDTVAYKFVLKDSNDTLIATYDNLVGINSNFIAYTAQQEIQTATAGQTVFNLTTMQYQPATNNLSVYVDGVNQYGPGAQYAYVETDTDTVTFVSGLHVGASVKFTTASPVASAVMNAENVAYDPPFFGAVGTNVEAKLAQTVSVKDFGAVGDGVTDDTAAINNALAAVSTTAQSVYFPAGTYLYDGGGLLDTGVVIYGDGRDATIIKSALATPTSNYLFKASGVGSGIRAMKFDANVTQIGGSYVWLSGPESFINDFHMNGDYNGILMTGSVSRIRHGRFQDGASGATRIRAEGGDNSQLIDDVLMGAQSPQVSFAGIRVRNSAALIISNTSVIQQGHNLLIDPNTATQSSNTADGSVFSMYVNNCFFDNASGNAIRINPTGTAAVVRCRFANCWAGSSASDGIYIVNGGSGYLQGLYFDSCHAVLNGTGGSGSGLTIGGNVSDVSINGGLFANNTDGIWFGSGCTNSKVCNATVGQGGGLSGNSANGITLDTGTTNITVVGNQVIGNTSSGVVAAGTTVAYVISDNFISANGTNIAVNATTNRVVRNNTGVNSPDMSSGTGLISIGNSSVVVTHGLGVAPDPSLIFIWPTDGWGANVCYVDSTTITSTQFTVKSTVVAAGILNFGWQARINNK